MRSTEHGGGAFEYYVRKNYYKTGSLMANSCRAAAVLGDHTLEVFAFAFRSVPCPFGVIFYFLCVSSGCSSCLFGILLDSWHPLHWSCPCVTFVGGRVSFFCDEVPDI